MDTKTKIQQFLAAPSFGVVGASDDSRKFGNKVYRCYLEHDMKAFPVNPVVKEIEGNEVYPNLGALPEKVESISVITPPPVTEKIVEDAIANGVKNIWMQPGAESKTAIDRATEAGVNVIAGGPCVLVELGFSG
jgi:predicted CoA-binding protein